MNRKLTVNPVYGDGNSYLALNANSWWPEPEPGDPVSGDEYQLFDAELPLAIQSCLAIRRWMSSIWRRIAIYHLTGLIHLTMNTSHLTMNDLDHLTACIPFGDESMSFGDE